jgi:hypothetical protein
MDFPLFLTPTVVVMPPGSLPSPAPWLLTLREINCCAAFRRGISAPGRDIGWEWPRGQRDAKKSGTRQIKRAFLGA